MNRMYSLEQLGFHAFFSEQASESELKVGRVSFSANERYKILCPEGEFQASILGKVRYLAESSRDLPSVGDWVLYQRLEGDQQAVIHKILDRKSILSRKVAGQQQKEQLLGTNIDVVLLVNTLNNDFNLRRMERYLYVVYESGATPVFVLTKKDLCEDVENKILSVERIAPGVPVVAVDSISGEGYDKLIPLIKGGNTYSLLGSSGVGKSTVLNQLFGEELQKTNDVRVGDHKGKHTTTHRELFVLPEGGIIIDTPGMRELQLWGNEETVNHAFEEIDALSKACPFTDCKHETEPNCAVKAAIENGELDLERLQNYRKFGREVRRHELKEKYGTNRANKIQYKEFKKRNSL